MASQGAVAVFKDGQVEGEVIVTGVGAGVAAGTGTARVKVRAIFTKLPPGKHGFHIHRAGDLRGKGCQGACDHWHNGPPTHHGGPPGQKGERHTGDLGNIELGPGKKPWQGEFILSGVKPEDFWGRSAIVHADEDDLGLGQFPDSLTTGHAGTRIGCAIFGRFDVC